MSMYNPFIQKLSHHFSMHPARLKTFAGMIMGLISGGNVQHHGLARQVNSTTQTAAIKRIERFFKAQKLPIAIYAITLTYLLDFSGKFKLRLDRINWKIGTKNVNYLVLSWHISKQVSLPLLFVELDKAGNSNTSERQDLIKMFINIFGEDRIAELVADREFIGDKWVRLLQENRIPFFIRMKENMLVPWGKKDCHLKDFLRNWESDRPRIVQKEMFGTIVYFAFKKIKNGELVIVMTNQDLLVNRILNIYKTRWSIETLFKNLKTSGFNWENTHMIDPERLTKLLIIMGLACLLICLIGARQKVPWRKTVDCPLRSQFRSGLLHFQFLMAQSLAHAINWLSSLIPIAPKLIVKSGG